MSLLVGVDLFGGKAISYNAGTGAVKEFWFLPVDLQNPDTLKNMLRVCRWMHSAPVTHIALAGCSALPDAKLDLVEADLVKQLPALHVSFVDSLKAETLYYYSLLKRPLLPNENMALVHMKKTCVEGQLFKRLGNKITLFKEDKLDVQHPRRWRHNVKANELVSLVERLTESRLCDNFVVVCESSRQRALAQKVLQTRKKVVVTERTAFYLARSALLTRMLRPADRVEFDIACGGSVDRIADTDGCSAYEALHSSGNDLLRVPFSGRVRSSPSSPAIGGAIEEASPDHSSARRIRAHSEGRRPGVQSNEYV